MFKTNTNTIKPELSKIGLVLIFLFISLSFNSCKKEVIQKGKTETLATAPKTDVKTFEIVNLISSKELADKYSGTFGSIVVNLFKTSDSTLTFYIPDLEQGNYVLKFELAEINFNVTKTIESDPDQLVTDIFQLYDARIAAFIPISPEDNARIDSLTKYKQSVLTLFNSLTPEQKRQTLLFYQANKAVFISFANKINTNINSPTIFRDQSACPRTNYKAFYNCTSENLGKAYDDLVESSREFLRMIAMSSAVAGAALNCSVLGPVAWGIAAVGISLPAGTAIYLFFVDVAPAGIKLLSATRSYIIAPWIFRGELFDAMVSQFPGNTITDLNLNAEFRTLEKSDDALTSGTGIFIHSFNNAVNNWGKLTTFIGNLPSYVSSNEAVTLTANEIKITEISNPNVELTSQTGEAVKFKSLSGNDEIFNYRISVDKEGFSEEKIMSGKVLGLQDSTELFRLSTIGSYQVSNYVGNGPSSELFADIKSTGQVVFTLNNDPSWPNGTTFNATWTIYKLNGYYYYSENGFWHPGYPSYEVNSPLSYPVTSFKFHNNTTYVK